MTAAGIKPKFKPLDTMTIILILFNLIVILIGWRKLDNAGTFLVKYIAAGLFVTVLNYRQKEKGLLRILQSWYPMLLFGFFFESSTLMNRIFIPDYLDTFFQKIDQAIFGYQPAIYWGVNFDSYFLQELMHFAYLTFYLMIPLLGIDYFLKDRKRFGQYMFTICFILYSCYVIYVIVPVIGGRYWQLTRELSKIYRYGIFTRIMAFVYRETAHWGGAIPSSHVAAAVGVLISVWKYRTKALYVMLPLVILLSLSTVYCHYHYFIDVIAGIFYGTVMYYLGETIYRKVTVCST